MMLKIPNKEKLIEYIDEYKSAKNISEKLGVNIKTIYRWCKKYDLKTTGNGAKINDITDQKFTRLKALYVSGTNKDRHKIWHCICDCGNELDVSIDELVSENTKSCGCLRLDAIKEKCTIHGESGSRLYCIWSGMKNRCYSERNKHYKNYGGRGIKVCDEWKESYENFHIWAIQNNYHYSLTIDRIDNNGNYEPSNCRWSTMKEQNNNRRSNVYFVYNGKKQTLTQWCEELKLNYGVVNSKINRGGTSIQKALGLE
jgi:hypothetical protein